MHIPDGYLSPSTCAVLYGGAVPFWWAAFARVKRLLTTRLVPLLAVASAFCFVIMMFNIPLPGGTTGHAVGVGAATVVLGPWAAMLSLSIALLMQAVFFGDGGITTLGANSFNLLTSSYSQRFGGLCGNKCFCVFGCLRIGHSAPLFQGCIGSSLICALLVECFDSGNDDRPFHVCGTR